MAPNANRRRKTKPIDDTSITRALTIKETANPNIKLATRTPTYMFWLETPQRASDAEIGMNNFNVVNCQKMKSPAA
jgi:hypothetical protein